MKKILKYIDTDRLGLAKSSFITFASNIISFAIGMGASIIFARILGPANKGAYAILDLIPAIFLKFGTLGIEVSNIYFAGRRRHSLTDIVSNSVLASGCLGFLLISIFYLIFRIDVSQNYLAAHDINPHFLLLIMMTVPLSLCSMFFNSILVGREKVIQYNGIGVIHSLIGIILIIIIMVWLKLGLFGAILFMIISAILGLGIKMVFVLRLTKIEFRLNYKLLIDSLKYGGKAYLGNLAQFLNYRLDMLIVALLLPLEQVGYYSLAVGLAENLWMLPGSIATVLFPRISSVDKKEADKLTPQASRFTFFVILMIAVVLSVIAKPLIRFLYGQAYIPAVLPFILLMPGIIALSVCKIFTADLAGRGRPEFGTIAAYAGLIVNIPMILYLIPRIGIAGAAIASSITYILNTLIVGYQFAKLSGNSLNNILLLKRYELKSMLSQLFSIPKTLYYAVSRSIVK